MGRAILFRSLKFLSKFRYNSVRVLRTLLIRGNYRYNSISPNVTVGDNGVRSSEVLACMLIAHAVGGGMVKGRLCLEGDVLPL